MNVLYNSVKESLDHAIDNDYNQVDESVESVAEDLIRYDKQFNDCNVADLTEHIHQWQMERKHGRSN